MAHYAIPPLCFGLVKCLVSMADERFCADSFAASDADTTSYGQTVGRRHEGCSGDGFAQTLSLSHSVFLVAVGEYHKKLLAPVTAQTVVATRCGRHAGGGLAKDGVAGQMAVGVVHLLEAVEIHHEEREPTRFTAVADHLLGE